MHLTLVTELTLVDIHLPLSLDELPYHLHKVVCCKV